MTKEDVIELQDEDEDVILEGSDLYEALINMGYSNFHSIPTVKSEYSQEKESPNTDNCKMLNKIITGKINMIYQYILQETDLTNELLRIILEGHILLDDHAAIVNEFFEDKQISSYGSLLKWIPFITSTVTATCYTLVTKKIDMKAVTLFFTIGYFAYKKLMYWITIKNLENFIGLQNKLHYLIKFGLNSLRHSHRKKSIKHEIHEKEVLISQEKYNIILSMKQLMIDIFENLSQFYYEEAYKILILLPDYLQSTCNLTKLKNKNNKDNDKDYDEIKSLYYAFVLIQSETIFIIANVFNVESKKNCFAISKTILTKSIKKLTQSLTNYHLKISKIMQIYQSCETQTIKRVFRGISSSIWKDVYIHLDSTSERIQLAYKQISSILECIDGHDEKGNNDTELIETIVEKMNEAYKHIENARSFAESSNVLITKMQHGSINKLEKKCEIEYFQSVNDDQKIVIIDKDLEIEDEMFEEDIKEEYLNRLSDNNDGHMFENFKLDKLLAENFMIELKEALKDKQKSMTERELKALQRMYDRISNNSNNNKTISEKLMFNEISTSLLTSPVLPSLLQPSLPPPPPPPQPETVTNVVFKEIATDNIVQVNNKLERKTRTPVPLPRVKTLQPEDVVPNVHRFSLNQCISNFPAFTEETFLGSGENSEEEDFENDNEHNENINEN